MTSFTSSFKDTCFCSSPGLEEESLPADVTHFNLSHITEEWADFDGYM